MLLVRVFNFINVYFLNKYNNDLFLKRSINIAFSFYFSYRFFNNIFSSEVLDYYMSDIYSKNSKVMSLCSKKINFSNLNILR